MMLGIAYYIQGLYYRPICLMNHQKTYQTNPMAQWDFLNVPVDPFVPPAAAPRPPETCPLTRVVPYKSFKDPSNVTIDTSKTSPLTP